MTAHSRLGPSSSERWLNCPGSVLLTKDMPDTSSEYAREGTAAHTLSEWARRENKPVSDYIGRSIEVEGQTFTVDREMADAVQVFVDYCDQLGGYAFFEERVQYDDYAPGGFGTADVIRVDGGVCYVTDLKHGRGVKVDARDNPQLKLYALGTYLSLKWLFPDIKEFRLAIVQPRLDHIDEWSITLDDLLHWAETVVRPAAMRAMLPGQPLVPGDHCQFCPAKVVCRAREQWVLDTVRNEMGDLDAPLLTNDEIAALLPRIESIRRWCGDLERYAFREVSGGRAVGDYKIVEGRSTRTWANEAAAIEYLDHMLGEDAYEPRKLISPAQAEKRLGKKNEVLQTLVTKPKGAPKLAPGSDPRPAIQIDVTQEFEVLE
jgi:hypothetical protein